MSWEPRSDEEAAELNRYIRALEAERDALREENARLREVLTDLAAVGGSPCEGDFKCDQCAVVMRPEYFASLMSAKILLAALSDASK